MQYQALLRFEDVWNRNIFQENVSLLEFIMNKVCCNCTFFIYIYVCVYVFVCAEQQPPIMPCCYVKHLGHLWRKNNGNLNREWELELVGCILSKSQTPTVDSVPGECTVCVHTVYLCEHPNSVSCFSALFPAVSQTQLEAMAPHTAFIILVFSLVSLPSPLCPILSLSFFLSVLFLSLCSMLFCAPLWFPPTEIGESRSR